MNKAFLGAITALTINAAAGASSPCSSSESACSWSKNDHAASVRTVDHHKAGTIVDVASKAGGFETLLTAAKAAGLVEALSGDGPITVLAPTDEAFSKLPAGTVGMLLEPENRGLLTQILTYHVIPGRVNSGTVKALDNAATLLGQRIDIEAGHAGITIDGAKVVKADIGASNGVIHVIDTVLMPATDDIVETAADAGTFNTLLAAAKAAGLAEVLGSEGPFTVFAPTDEAFAALPEGTVESLLEPQNRDKLASILKYHVVEGRLYADAALEAGDAQTALGESVRIKKSWGGVKINDSKVVSADIEASNGVIHVIDTVLLPG